MILSLIPIVLGVSLASMSELSFTWLAFGAAMVSNLAFASRNIYARLSLDKPKGENMTPENLYGVLTLLAFAFSLPFALLIEGPTAAAALKASSIAPAALTMAVARTGAYFYFYNEVSHMRTSSTSRTSPLPLTPELHNLPTHPLPLDNTPHPIGGDARAQQRASRDTRRRQHNQARCHPPRVSHRLPQPDDSTVRHRLGHRHWRLVRLLDDEAERARKG